MSAAPTHRVVNSRAELEQFLRDSPLQLKAARLSRPPRIGHPDFIGPVDPLVFGRVGVLHFGADGGPSITLRPPFAPGAVRVGGKT